jgi:hypothetical protein
MLGTASTMRRATGIRQQLSSYKADFFKALAHPLRISILHACGKVKLTVNENIKGLQVWAVLQVVAIWQCK